MNEHQRDVTNLYERHAHEFDAARTKALPERKWLDRFLAFVPVGGTVLDVGCGSGEPMAQYIIEQGRQITGIDASPTMINLCQTRFPEHEWLVQDMRNLNLGERQFDGIIAWDSFFHLPHDDQRQMFTRFAKHARRGAPLMFTSGTQNGVAIADWFGESLYHASLDTSEYRQLLHDNGFAVNTYMENDKECGDHTIWLATREVSQIQDGNARGSVKCLGA